MAAPHLLGVKLRHSLLVQDVRVRHTVYPAAVNEGYPTWAFMSPCTDAAKLHHR